MITTSKKGKIIIYNLKSKKIVLEDNLKNQIKNQEIVSSQMLNNSKSIVISLKNGKSQIYEIDIEDRNRLILKYLLLSLS